ICIRHALASCESLRTVRVVFSFNERSTHSRFTPYRLRVFNFPMAEDDQVHGRLPDELAERFGQTPLSSEAKKKPGSVGRRKSLFLLHIIFGLKNRPNGVSTSRMRYNGGRGWLLSEQAPFMNLLPAEIILSDMKDQELLGTILVGVRRQAYSHLVVPQHPPGPAADRQRLHPAAAQPTHHRSGAWTDDLH
ncbi:hypothetical protein PENTCL1PPCAC_5309, partial [Pristionchus entomophagus]